MIQSETTIRDYGGGIYALEQPEVRAFLIVGSRKALLLDTGAVRMDICGFLAQITSLPVTVVLTHGDGDHIGNLADFDRAYIHAGDMAAVSAHAHCQHVRLLPLLEGDELDLGGRTLKVLFTPGHTAGSICLLDEANKLLFAGDTVSYGPVYMFGARRHMRSYLESLERLARMRAGGVYHTVYCCHNTCPIPADTVETLVTCVQGILDGSIPGAPAPTPTPTGEKPLLCQYGRCTLYVNNAAEKEKAICTR